MKTFAFRTLAAILFVISLQGVSATPRLTSAELEALLSHPARPAEDAARDEARMPGKIMAFTGIAKGQHILDLFAGGGWYSELFSHAVGSEGKVYMQNDEVIWRFAEQRVIKRTANNRLANVERFDNMPIVEVDVPDNSLDVVFTALNYHDLFFTEFTRDGKVNKVREEIVDYKAALSRVKRAMKDDAVFIIIDHAAQPGSGYQAANIEHRIDPDIVKFQMREAGFKLVEEAFYLRNPKDDLRINVFDAAIRGKTDRFVYKFTKQ